MPDTVSELDARKIPHQQRHETIFRTYDDLKVGESFILINDHDPKPLRYQMAAVLQGDKFSWEYLEEGPNVWKVQIGKNS